jgi:hypothetical protein
MNALDRLATDVKERSSATPIEKIILAHPDATVRLLAAAQWMQIQTRAKYVNLEDMSEIRIKDVDEPNQNKTRRIRSCQTGNQV